MEQSRHASENSVLDIEELYNKFAGFHNSSETMSFREFFCAAMGYVKSRNLVELKKIAQVVNSMWTIHKKLHPEPVPEVSNVSEEPPIEVKAWIVKPYDSDSEEM